MKETIEEQLRNMRISKDDPTETLRRKIEELEKENKKLKKKSNSTSGEMEICTILRRRTGDGEIKVVNKKVTCEYSSIYKTTWTETEYSECKISEKPCSYTGLPGYSEL